MKGPGPLAATVPKYLLKVRDDAVKFVKDVVVGSDTPMYPIISTVEFLVM